MLIELDIFSGRPNPRFRLSARDGRTLVALHEALRAAKPEPLSLPGLGYRGFVYSIGGPMRAFRGHITGPSVALSDPTMTVERFLLDRLPPEHSALRPAILAALR